MAWRDGGWSNSWENYNNQHWGQDDYWKTSWDWNEKKGGKKEKPNWKKAGGQDVSTLGLKHPMPLEDRRDLVLSLINRLRDDVEGTQSVSFKLAVAGWGPVLLHAVFFHLCRARPCMKVGALRNEDDEYVLEDAVDILYTEMNGVLTTWEDKKAALKLLCDCRHGSPEKLLAVAKEEGFDANEVEPKGTAASGSGAPAQIAASAPAAGPVTSVPPGPSHGTGQPRTLTRMDTEEEIKNLRKKNEVMDLRVALAEKEKALKSQNDPVAQPGRTAAAQMPAPRGGDAEHLQVLQQTLPPAALAPTQLRSTSTSGASPQDLAFADKERLQVLAQNEWNATLLKLDGQPQKQEQAPIIDKPTNTASDSGSQPPLDVWTQAQKMEAEVLRIRREIDASRAAVQHQEELMLAKQELLAHEAAEHRAEKKKAEEEAEQANKLMLAKQELLAHEAARAEKVKAEEEAEQVKKRYEEEEANRAKQAKADETTKAEAREVEEWKSERSELAVSLGKAEAAARSEAEVLTEIRAQMTSLRLENARQEEAQKAEEAKRAEEVKRTEESRMAESQLLTEALAQMQAQQKELSQQLQLAAEDRERRREQDEEAQAQRTIQEKLQAELTALQQQVKNWEAEDLENKEEEAAEEGREEGSDVNAGKEPDQPEKRARTS